MKRRLLVVLGLVGLLSAVLASPVGAAEAGSGRSVSPVKAADGSVTGYSVLRRGDSEARFRLLTSKLEAGHAYTIWWVVFNHPEHCVGATDLVRCGMADMANPEVDASALFADGGVVGRFGVGWFSGSPAGGRPDRRHHGHRLARCRGRRYPLRGSRPWPGQLRS